MQWRSNLLMQMEITVCCDENGNGEIMLTGIQWRNHSFYRQESITLKSDSLRLPSDPFTVWNAQLINTVSVCCKQRDFAQLFPTIAFHFSTRTGRTEKSWTDFFTTITFSLILTKHDNYNSLWITLGKAMLATNMSKMCLEHTDHTVKLNSGDTSYAKICWFLRAYRCSCFVLWLCATIVMHRNCHVCADSQLSSKSSKNSKL